MKCSKCGFENKDNAKFCTKCGEKLAEDTPSPTVNQGSNNSKIIVALLIVIIVILVAVIASFVVNNNSDSTSTTNASGDSVKTTQEDSVEEDSNKQTTQVSDSSKSKTKSWESIGRYSGSGSGTQKIDVPAGKIMVKLSAFPIKNYADNHLYVTGSSGTGGVDWGPTSDVETRSDSFECTLSSSETFTIDYYETVSWEVEFFRYQ